MNNYELWKNNENLDPILKEELLGLNEDQIQDAFSQDLSFGTAGMRGLLGVGTNRLNIYTINKATRGLAKYLLETYPNEEIRVAICYDSRHYSKEFSEICAKTLATFGISSYLYDDVKPTPLLSYLVRHHNCQAGIMITASHNPKEYNGYKVYNSTGSQLNIEEANSVIAKINDIDDIFDFSYDESKFDLINYVDDSVEQDYLDQIHDIEINKDVNKDIKIVFTPEHGTSYEVMPRCFKQYGYNNVICVKEQMQPDGDFPNTKTSNPEESDAFLLAIEYANKNDADLIIANDPDADRLGIMVKHNGEYVALSGNQTGTLMIDYLINHTNIDNKIIYKTIVTGEMGANIAKSRGVEVKELLTGFKFIGEQIELLDNKDKFMFGYEESYGYLIKPLVRDKDAIQASLLIAEMVAFYKDKGITLVDRQEELYNEYGYFSEVTYSLTYNQPGGMEVIKEAMANAREKEITNVCGLDISNKIDFITPQNGLPSADVVKFYLEDKGWFVLRPSGTEPKLKIYVSIKQDSLEKATSLNERIYNEVKSLFNLD